MSARLSAKQRKLLLVELRAHEGYTMKAIGQRHGVSRQTLSRLRAELLLEGLSGKMSLEAKRPKLSADERHPSRSNASMTDAEIREKIEQLERRADVFHRSSVEIGANLVAILDAAAAERGTTRHHLAASAVRAYLAQNPDLICPADSHTH